MDKIKPKIIREQVGKTIITHTHEGGIIKHVKYIGEIHMVLKNSKGEVIEDRLTKDKQKKESKDDK